MKYDKDLTGYNDLSETNGARHITEHLEDYEVARSGFFQLEIDAFTDGGNSYLVRPDWGGDEADKANNLITNGSDVIRLSVDSTTVPHFQVSDIAIERGNTIVHFAGKPSWNGGRIVCKDFVGMHTKEVLMAWQRLTYDPITDRGGVAIKYKRNCFLTEYTQDFQPIRKWQIIGMFPTNVDEGDFDRTKGEEARSITVDFVYDRAYLVRDNDNISSGNSSWPR